MTRPLSYGAESRAALYGFSVMYPREEHLTGAIAGGPRVMLEAKKIAGGRVISPPTIQPFAITRTATAGPDDEDRPRCADASPEVFFDPDHEQEARALCRRCPRLTVCEPDPADLLHGGGVWGGLTLREWRARLRKEKR